MVFLIHTELRCTVNHTSDSVMHHCIVCYQLFHREHVTNKTPIHEDVHIPGWGISIQSFSGWLNLSRLHKILRYLTGVTIAGLHSEVAVSNTVYEADYPY